MKAAIYCRLSEEDKNKLHETDDSNSIQNQKAMLIQYAQEQGWEIFDIYSDDDYTGSDRGRPQFNRMLKHAKARKFDIVLCKTQSRFTRELELVEKYIHGLFPVWGIRFVSIVDNADTDNKGNKKSRQINGLVNEWYLEDMSENIRSVLTSRRQNGFHIGSFAPYGYKKDPDLKGHLIIDPEAAAVVREVFTLFSQGYGKTAIARLLNDRGIPNPSEYKRQMGLRYKGTAANNSTLWKYYSISEMLTNEVYIGNLIQGKYGSVSYKTQQIKPRPQSQWIRVNGTHEAIIDQQLWDKVQNLIAQKAKPFDTGQIGLFARKARCAHCGYILRSSKNRGRHYLQCQTRYVARGACVGAFISVNELEQIILKELKTLSDALLDQNELANKIAFATNLTSQKERLLAEIAIYEKRIGEYTKGIKGMYLDKVRGILTECDFKTLAAEFSSEKERLTEMVKDCNKKLQALEERLAAGDDRLGLIKQYLGMEHLTREIVDILIDHVTIGKRNTDTKMIPVEIYWNF